MKCLLLLLLHLLPMGIYAQHSIATLTEKQYSFRRLEIEKGLSHNQINCIYKDKSGFMWFGTMSGLNRFDGSTFKIFKHNSKDSTSIDDDFISKILELPDEKLWIETRNRVNIYDPMTEKFSHDAADYLPSLSLPGTKFITMEKNAAGAYYFLFAQQGLYKYDPATRKSIKIVDGSIEKSTITGFTKDTNGDFWLIQNNGLIEKLDGKTDKIVYQSKALGAYTNNELLNYSLFADDQQKLWIYIPSEPRGVFHLDPATGTIEQITKEGKTSRLNTNLVMGVLQDNQSRIWIGTDHGGINVLNRKNQSVQYVLNNTDDNTSLSQNSITALYKDDEGIIWVGTYKRGINYYHENILKFPLYRHQQSNPSSLSYNDVNRFAEDAAGNIWIGTNGGGLLYFDRTAGKFKQYLHQPTNPASISNDVIVSLCIDKQQKLWIGSYFGGLDCYDGKTFTHYQHNPADSNSLSDNRVWEIYEDVSGRLWVGTLSSGLDMFDQQRKVFRHYKSSQPNSIHSDYISEITENKQGDLWVGTATGIDILENRSDKILHYDYNPADSGSLSNGNVLSIHVDAADRVWVGTREGLNLYDPQHRSFRHFGVENGLPDNTILNILEDEKSNLWVSTPNGISQVTLYLGKSIGEMKISCKNYNESDGLQGIEFNENAAFKTSKGELIFGGPNGFNLFWPQNIAHPRQTTKLVFTGFQLFNQTIVPGELANGKVLLPQAINKTKSITLRYDQNVISIAFIDLDFSGADRSKYTYMLEGFNVNWLTTDGKSKEAVFTNLDPGTYTLRVKKEGAPNSESITLQIKILPPFWKTGPAYFFYFLLISALLYIGRRRIIHKTRARFAIEQERKEAKRMHELDLMKIKFLTNVSHEFRTPLSLILAPVDKMLKHSADGQQKQQLHLIHRNAKRLLSLVNQLLDFRKMEEKELTLQPTIGNIIQYIRDTSSFFVDVAEKKNISFSFHTNIDTLETAFDHEKMERVLFNLLSNAFKFTTENGHVGVEIKATPLVDDPQLYNLIIEVRDTGIGIAPDKQEKIFERFFQNEVPGSMVNQGSGIGLSIAKEFVKFHGGNIRVESEPDKGSCFIIHLPVKAVVPNLIAAGSTNITETTTQVAMSVSTDETTLSDVEPLQNQETSKQYPKKPALLLVEDNEEFRFYLKDSLKPYYNIIEAIDGNKGWQKALAAHPDLIVSDISMPEMDGITLCKKIKNDKRTSHIPIILLTALSGEEQQLQGLETGANDYMTKPFNFDILLSKIKNQLSQQEQTKKTYQKQVEIKPADVQVDSPDEKFLQQLLVLIEKEMANPDFSVEDMSHEMFMSRVTLYKKILALTGKTPIEFLRQVRLQRAAQLLKKGQPSVAEVAYQVGFNNPKYFARYFKQEFGIVPSAYGQEKQ